MFVKLNELYTMLSNKSTWHPQAPTGHPPGVSPSAFTYARSIPEATLPHPEDRGCLDRPPDAAAQSLLYTGLTRRFFVYRRGLPLWSL